MNTFDIGNSGNFRDFHESDDEGYDEPALFAAASEHDIEVLLHGGAIDIEVKASLLLLDTPRILPGLYAERHFGTYFDDVAVPFSEMPAFFDEPTVFSLRRRRQAVALCSKAGSACPRTHRLRAGWPLHASNLAAAEDQLHAG